LGLTYMSKQLSRFLNPKVRMVLIFLVVVILVIVGLAGISAARYDAAYKIPGASESWNRLLGTAEIEAANQDSGAILEQVTSFNDDPTNRLPCPQEYTFDFLRASGVEMTVKVSDTAPPKVVDVNASASEKAVPSSDYLAKLKEALTYVKLGPHEICPLAAQDGLNYKEGPELYLRLGNAANDPELLHDPQWTIWYMDGTSASVSPNDTLMLWVSSRTGQLAKRGGIK
jgi:hypothetical protein